MLTTPRYNTGERPLSILPSYPDCLSTPFVLPIQNLFRFLPLCDPLSLFRFNLSSRSSSPHTQLLVQIHFGSYTSCIYWYIINYVRHKKATVNASFYPSFLITRCPWGTEQIIAHRDVMQIPLQKLLPADNRERMGLSFQRPIPVPGSVLSSKRLIDHHSSASRERITEPAQSVVLYPQISSALAFERMRRQVSKVPGRWPQRCQ